MKYSLPFLGTVKVEMITKETNGHLPFLRIGKVLYIVFDEITLMFCSSLSAVGRSFCQNLKSLHAKTCCQTSLL